MSLFKDMKKALFAHH